MFYISIGLVLVILGHVRGFNDPCIEHSILPKSSHRGTECEAKNGKEICDRYLIGTDSWYRVVDYDTGKSEQIVTKCQPLFRCSTHYPIWMNGSHPSVEDNIVNRSACVQSHEGCCGSTLDIQVKNCRSFFVYFLRYTEYCPQAYCFGENKVCPPPDPCDQENYRPLQINKDRYPSCRTKGEGTCDMNMKSDWYRIKNSTHDFDISGYCVDNNKCGTQNPIWLKGKIPDVSERIVNRTVCVNDGVSCCNKSYDIQIKNCSNFVVYNLTPPDECPEGYCFGEERTCPVPDPCKAGNHKVLEMNAKRSPACSTMYNPMCDSDLVEGWYRVNTDGMDYNMPRHCVNNNYCSTQKPIWLKGAIPDVSEEIVNRTVCVNTGRSCCEKTYKIQMKNCTKFAVYYLVPTDGCPESYCFGNSTVCLSSANKIYNLKNQNVLVFMAILGLLMIG